MGHFGLSAFLPIAKSPFMMLEPHASIPEQVYGILDGGDDDEDWRGRLGFG
jgi:hypothetical protein